MKLVKRESWIEEQLEMSNYINKRKHYSQMSTLEINRTLKRLRDVESWLFTEHALDRMDEKGINATYQDIASTLFNCEILEYKIDYNERKNRCEERVVVRSKTKVNGNYNLNIVFSLTTKKVITVWLNHFWDRHITLDWSIYDENMKVFGL